MTGNYRGEERGQRLALVLRAVVVVAVMAVATPVPTGPAAGASATTLVVTSTAWGGADASPGDGVCKTAAGVCTLRAAVEESNALRGQPGDVTITVDPSIGLATTMTGTPNVGADLMLTANITARDKGAYLHVTSPVTIDLGHRLRVDGSANNNLTVAAFYFDGPDIQVLNADMVMSPGSSFVFGPKAARVTVDGDTGGGFATIVTPNGYPERFAVLREGASDVTVKNYQITGYSDGNGAYATYGGIVVFNTYSTAPVRKVLVDRVQVLQSANSNDRCTPTTGAGCKASLVNFWKGASSTPAWGGAVIDGLTFRNMVVRNLTNNQYGFQFRAPSNVINGNADSAEITDLVIEDSIFTNNNGRDSYNDTSAFVGLPHNERLHGTSSISRNVFVRAASGPPAAIFYFGGAGYNSVVSSGLTIADNYFDGYTSATGSTLRLHQASLVTVTGNTFGKASGSQARPAVAEEYSDGPVMVNNYRGGGGLGSNQSIRTWAPTSKATTDAKPDALVMTGARIPAPTCTATVEVTRITADDNWTQAPGEPVTLQAYWTADRTAELYLGQVTGVRGTKVTVAFGLPAGSVTLPDGTSVKVVDAKGEATGYVRFQTHVEGLAQLESSQYSRVVAVTGPCEPTDPAITITKRAYVDVADGSSPERVEATGTLAVTGSQLVDGQAVCFVYTVTNVSTGAKTTLTDVVVTDTDTRLGVDGVVGTFAALQANRPEKLVACTTLVPVDTTVANIKGARR